MSASLLIDHNTVSRLTSQKKTLVINTFATLQISVTPNTLCNFNINYFLKRIINDLTLKLPLLIASESHPTTLGN